MQDAATRPRRVRRWTWVDSIISTSSLETGAREGAGKEGVALTRWQALADLLLALLITVLAGISAGLTGIVLAAPAVALIALQALLILIAIAVLVRWRGQNWGALRLRAPRPFDLGRGLGLLLLIMLLNAAGSMLVDLIAPELFEGHEERLGEVAAEVTGGVPFGVVAATMLLVGFYEELLARGLLLQRAQVLLKGFWPPLLFAALLFGLGHFYQGWAGVAQTALIGLVFGYFVLRWNSLWPSIIAHAGLNTLSLALLRSLS